MTACIRRYEAAGKFLNNIGKDNRMKGFLIPNGVVDFGIDADGIIHAANPGKHRVERYTPEGELLGHIGRFDGLDPAGFSGCCNPTNVTVADGDRIYVTEKAEPRAKVYDFQGKLLAVIATDVFDPNCKNMDIAVDAARTGLCRRHRDSSRSSSSEPEAQKETAMSEDMTRRDAIGQRWSVALFWLGVWWRRRLPGSESERADRLAGRRRELRQQPAWRDRRRGVHPMHDRMRRGAVRCSGCQRILQVRALQYLSRLLQHQQRGGRERLAEREALPAGRDRAQADRPGRSRGPGQQLL